MNSQNNTNESIVKISHLSRQFDQQMALDNISIEVKAGQIFGIIGENGAGKTTLIKHMLGQYKAQQGSVKIFGKNPVDEPKQVLSEIGYLSEEPELPLWMTIEQLLNYTSAFYPAWDEQYASELVEQFDLQRNKRVRDLSKGQKARIGLVLAQAFRPKLLLLDEPSSGLDPNVRRDILSAAIKTVSNEGRTVIFSSHLLDEVERVCDHLIMIGKGQILLSDSMENILNNHHRITVKKKTINRGSVVLNFPGVFNTTTNGDEYQIDFFGDKNNVIDEFVRQEIPILATRAMSLNDIFISRTNVAKGV